MKIQAFAVLKDFFDKEFILTGSVATIAELKSRLMAINPEASVVLEICRFAVNDEFVDLKYQLKENDTICIIPPSSGG